MGAVHPAPGLGADGVDLERHPVRPQEVVLDVPAVDERGVREDGHRDVERPQRLDRLAEARVERRLAVGYEREVVDALPPGAQVAQPLLDLAGEALRREELPSLVRELGRAPDLAVHAGIAADLVGHVVDAEASPQASRGDRAEDEVAHGRGSQAERGTSAAGTVVRFHVKPDVPPS